MVNQVTLPRRQHRMSLAITKPLLSSINCQAFRADMAASKNEQAHCKRVLQKEGQNERKLEAEKVNKSLSPKQQRCARAAQEKATSSYARQQHQQDSRFHSSLHQHISKIYHSFCHSFLSALLFLYAPTSLRSSALISSSFFHSHLSSVYSLPFPSSTHS